jgi:hypothetical protein
LPATATGVVIEAVPVFVPVPSSTNTIVLVAPVSSVYSIVAPGVPVNVMVAVEFSQI